MVSYLEGTNVAYTRLLVEVERRTWRILIADKSAEESHNFVSIDCIKVNVETVQRYSKTSDLDLECFQRIHCRVEGRSQS